MTWLKSSKINRCVEGQILCLLRKDIYMTLAWLLLSLPISSCFPIQSVVSLGARQATPSWHCARTLPLASCNLMVFFPGRSSPALCRLHNIRPPSFLAFNTPNQIFVKHVRPTSYDELSKKSAKKVSRISRKWKGLLETVPFFGTLRSDDIGDTVRSCTVWNYIEIWLVQVTKFCSFHTRKLSKPCMIHPINTQLEFNNHIYSRKFSSSCWLKFPKMVLSPAHFFLLRSLALSMSYTAARKDTTCATHRPRQRCKRYTVL